MSSNSPWYRERISSLFCLRYPNTGSACRPLHWPVARAMSWPVDWSSFLSALNYAVYTGLSELRHIVFQVFSTVVIAHGTLYCVSSSMSTAAIMGIGQYINLQLVVFLCHPHLFFHSPPRLARTCACAIRMFALCATLTPASVGSWFHSEIGTRILFRAHMLLHVILCNWCSLTPCRQEMRKYVLTPLQKLDFESK